jgi:hypothetical protein
VPPHGPAGHHAPPGIDLAGRPSYRKKPRLSVGQVLAWARAYRARQGHWPTAASGRVAESPDTTWMAVNAALSQGGAA